jgi:NAD(P)H dehydrogenase (quinone)
MRSDTMTQTVKHAIIACHPSERSFTLAMAKKYAEAVHAHGHETVLRDLYRTGFDPVLKEDEREGHSHPDVIKEWGVLGKCDVFVMVYPIWFGAPPAMLVGYIDRVLGAGRKRGSGGEAGPADQLAGKRLVSLTSSGTSRTWLDEKGVLGSLRNIYDRYLAEVFGFDETSRYHFDGVTAGLPERDVQQHLFDVEKAARAVMSRMTPCWTGAGHPIAG